MYDNDERTSLFIKTNFMTIEPISKEQFVFISNIQKEHKTLTFQNVGFQYRNKDKLSEDDKADLKEVSDILKKHITGFVEFNNFQISNKTKEVKIRFQYDWCADDRDDPHSNLQTFIGVGYLFLEELYKGFKKI